MGYFQGASAVLGCVVGAGLVCAPACAEDLFRGNAKQSLSSDLRAGARGDLVTVVVVQAAESSTTMQNGSQRSSSVNGRVNAGSFDESAGLSLGGAYNGRGEVRRSERFVTQMTASISEIMPNGDYRITGAQRLSINGEATLVEVQGRIRPSDIDSQNRVPSNRIADAQINYNGKGFVSRSSRPGLVQRIFGLLGLL